MRARPEQADGLLTDPRSSPFSLGLATFKSPLFHLQVLLAFAVLLGGGGVSYGLRNLAIQLLALAVLAINAPRVAGFAKSAPVGLIVLVIVTMAFPLLQLVPLPASVWQALPGRELMVESLEIAGIDPNSGRALSLSPMRSFIAFCGTLAPATLIVIGATLSSVEKTRLLWGAVLFGLIACLIGGIQLASSNNVGLFYGDERSLANVLYATFANRNSTALFFVITLCFVVGLPPTRNRWALLLAFATAPILVLGTVLTQSRSGMALLAIPVGLGALRLIVLLLRKDAAPKARLPRFVVAIACAAAVLLALVVSYSTLSGGRAAESFSRFSISHTDRPEMWEDGLYAARQYWPVGAGAGAFDDVFQVHESLEYVSPRRAGRAHNDYIELAIEAGLPGIVLALAWLLWAGIAALRPGLPEHLWVRLGAGSAVMAIALQSSLDYPLRNQALLCVAAVAIIMLARERQVRP